jgi:uncharacterized protein (UPF0254 family)
MASPDYLSFEGTLTRNAEMRQVMCDKRGQLRAAVCLHMSTTVGKRPVHAQHFFPDAIAAQAYAKGLRKGAVVVVHIAIPELHLSGVADFVEVQTPAPELAIKSAAALSASVNAQEPELLF